MDFREWINLNESVKLIQNYLRDHQIVQLGKFGWWTVYSALKSDKPPNRVITSDEYNRLLQSNQVRYDHVVDMKDSVNYYFTDAAMKLASLGFPSMHSAVLIVDLSDKVNPITGGGTGGEAHRVSHGITVDRSNIDVGTIVHEHAHMFWFNLPPFKKEFFRKYYQEAIKKTEFSKEELWQAADIRFDAQHLPKVFDYGWELFEEELGRITGIPPKSYLAIKTAENQQDFIRGAILRKFRESCKAKLKISTTFENFSKRTINLSPGAIVEVENAHRYLLNYWVNDTRYEYPKPILPEELSNFVEFDYDILSSEQKADYQRAVKLLKLKPSQVLASMSKKEEISQAFMDSLEKIANNFSRTNHGTRTSNRYSMDQIFNKWFNYYNSWVAIVSRRFKNNGNIDQLKQAYYDTILKGLKKGFVDEIPNELSDLPDVSNVDLSKPKSQQYRDFIYQKGLVASSYGAANVDELWATAVEYAATKQNVPPKLKKLIYSTISGR